MQRRVLLVILVLSLICVWSGAATAGQIGYSMRSMETGFGTTPQTAPPNSSVVAVDAIIGRPLGLATAIAGTGVYLVTLPFSPFCKSRPEAAWGLAGRPASWTFLRPLGRGAPEFEEEGVFNKH